MAHMRKRRARKCRRIVQPVDALTLNMNLASFFFSSRRRHTRWTGDWSSDVCYSDLEPNLTSPCRQLAPVVRDPGKSKKEAGEHRNEPQQQSGGGPISRTSGQPKPGAQQKEHEARFEDRKSVV